MYYIECGINFASLEEVLLHVAFLMAAIVMLEGKGRGKASHKATRHVPEALYSTKWIPKLNNM